MSRSPPLRIGNMSGYYGDRFDAAIDLVRSGEVDVLTGDYLAELTMLILWKLRQKDPNLGYATTFPRQITPLLGECAERGVKIVTNAGGLNPLGLARVLEAEIEKQGLSLKVAAIDGDDVVGQLPAWLDAGYELRHLDTQARFQDLTAPAVTANAYLGGWGIKEALDRGADIVVCPRVTDAALVVGPSAWAFGWSRDDWDRLAGAVVAGHVIECGAQATGGNFAFFQEIGESGLPGFPIAEMYPDGSCVITKPARTGGAVTIGTVTAQILYEIGGARYANPDVVTRFDSIELEQAERDRVRISGVRGEPAPGTAKIAINYVGGYRNEMTMVLTGLDIEAKARSAQHTLECIWGDAAFDALDFDLWRTDRADPKKNEEACALLRVSVKDRDKRKAGRQFSDAFVQAALSSYPGFFLTSPPSEASEYGVYWPTLAPAELVTQRVTLPGGETIAVPHVAPTERAAAPLALKPIAASRADAETVSLALGRVFGTRSGDKGGNANLGVWARDGEAFAWLNAFLTVDKLHQLLPDLAAFRTERHVFANINALNFVVVGLLGEGVASSIRLDRQAKGLGEYLGCKIIDAPAWLARAN